MSSVPRLTRRDLSDALGKRYPTAHQERRSLVAFFGVGERDVVETPAGSFEIIPIPSELGLREELLKVRPNGQVAFLVPWSGDLPLDIAGRFSGGGRVLRIGVESRLKSLFGVRDVDPEARENPLAQYLLRRAGTASYPIGAGRLTRQALFEVWFSRDLGMELSGGLGLDLLLAWAATDVRGPQVATALTSDAAPGVREATLKYLSDSFGIAGPVIWQAWETGKGRAALELALLFEPTAPSTDGAVRMWVRMAAKQHLAACPEGRETEVAEALAKAAATALRVIERRSAQEAMTILRAADARPVEPEARARLVESPRLPSAWKMRQDKLGEALLAGSKEPSREAVERARQALNELERHSLFRDKDRAADVRRAEMALRLLAWLAAWKAHPVEPSPVPQRDAEELGAWYAEDGGFVDFARIVARGSADSAFGRGVQAVVDAADRVRAELDERFSRSLARWLEAARPTDRVVPIEQALKRVGVKFLEGHDERSLLILLLDGLAWAQAVELLESLGSRAWGPLAWHNKEGNIGGKQYPVVFAGLPTITEVSRAEFFAGKLLSPGETGNTTKDPERFAAHRDLKKFVPPHELPRLLLRGEGHSTDGSASEEALSLIRDTTRRLVAIVVNAIDDSLKSSTQQVTQWTVDNIRSLAQLLEVARESGRSVLIASDHGHVPGHRLERVGSFPSAGARWRPWNEGDAPSEHEVAVSGTGVHAPKGSKGVILLANETSRYGSAAHSGEHGGATLAEVIAPCFLIGTDEPGSERHGADKALVPKPAYQPDWWQYEVWSAHEPAPEKPKARPRQKTPENQTTLPLIDVAPPPPAAPPRKPTPKPGALLAVDLESPFARSELLAARAPKAEQRKLVVAAVQYLLERHGVASGEAFAGALGTLPYRVQGLVSSLQETLNVDGYAVLSYDPPSKTVRLDKEKLCQQFEVKL